MPILAETHNGQLRMQGNELIIDAKDADASKFRVGSRNVPGESGGGGAYSFDVIDRVEEGSPRKEVAIIVGGFNGTQGEIGICVWNGQEPFGDATQIKVMEIRGNEVEFKVPVKGLPAAGGPVRRFYTDHGLFAFNMQDDEIDPITEQHIPSCIVYNTNNGSTDETTWTAVGRLRIDPL